MGNILQKIRQKKAETPQDILGIDRMATLAETEKAYRRLASSSRTDELAMIRLNDAVASAKLTLDIDGYTEELLQTDFPKYPIDFFDRAILIFKLQSAPRITNPDFQRFYTFWQRFRHEDKEIERKFLKVVRMIKKMDTRTKVRKIAVEIPKERETQKGKEKKQKTWKHRCEECNKGFQSENTFKDHLKSQTHRARTKGLGKSMDPVPTVEKHKAAENSGENNSIRAPKNECKNNAASICPSEPTRQEEHPLYRTCSYCNSTLETRGKLISHIRESHMSGSERSS